MAGILVCPSVIEEVVDGGFSVSEINSDSNNDTKLQVGLRKDNCQQLFFSVDHCNENPGNLYLAWYDSDGDDPDLYDTGMAIWEPGYGPVSDERWHTLTMYHDGKKLHWFMDNGKAMNTGDEGITDDMPEALLKLLVKAKTGCNGNESGLVISNVLVACERSLDPVASGQA